MLAAACAPGSLSNQKILATLAEKNRITDTTLSNDLLFGKTVLLFIYIPLNSKMDEFGN